MSLQSPVSRQRRGWDVDVPERLDPFRRMSQQMERMFEDLMGGGMPSLGQRLRGELGGALGGALSGLPVVDVSETKDALEIDADLPGLDERDIDITLNNGILTIRGERREEREEKGRNYFRTERNIGHFVRRIALPYEVDEDKIDARFDRGVLHVTLPKSADVKARERHIQIRKG